MVFLPGHAVVHQIFVHLAVDAAAVIEVEAEEAAGVHQLRLVDRRRAVGVEIFRAFGLDEDGVRPPLQYLDHRQHVRLDDVLERGDEAPVVGRLLVPPAVFGREDRADEHLVDRRVELHPGEAVGEGAGIGGEELREIRVLEIADPVGNSEMAEVDDRRDVAPLQLGEGEVGEFPIVLVGAEQGAVERRPVAKEMDAELVDAVEIGLPVPVMAARLHLVDPGAAAVDGRDAVLDPGREHEIGDDGPPCGVARRSRLTRERRRCQPQAPENENRRAAEVAFRKVCPLTERTHALGRRFHRRRLGNDEPPRLAAGRRRRLRRRDGGRQGHPGRARGRLRRGRRARSGSGSATCRC